MRYKKWNKKNREKRKREKRRKRRKKEKKERERELSFQFSLFCSIEIESASSCGNNGQEQLSSSHRLR
jgi:hypothetical protein